MVPPTEPKEESWLAQPIVAEIAPVAVQGLIAPAGGMGIVNGIVIELPEPLKMGFWSRWANADCWSTGLLLVATWLKVNLFSQLLFPPFAASAVDEQSKFVCRIVA